MQNRAARVISGKPYEIRSEAILQELGWQFLSDRWNQNRSIFMYKVKNGKFLTKTTNMFETKNNKFHHLRNDSYDFCLQKPKAIISRKKVLVMRVLKSGTICLKNFNKVICHYQDFKLCSETVKCSYIIFI